MAIADARRQMIDAAERIAAERGLGAMSLREVQVAAGQRNKSAAQYHFGSRDGLVEAVVSARMGPINERRLEMLGSLDPGAGVRPLVEALVLPLADVALRQPGSCWARFLLQGWADPTLAGVVRRSLDASSFRTVRRLLIDALDHLPPEVRARRVDHAVGLVVLSLAADEASTSRTSRSAALDDRVTDLVDMCVGVLAAPSTTTAGSAGRSTQEAPC